MSLEEFVHSTKGDAEIPPAGLSAALLSLWYDARGDWESAHKAAQDDPARDPAWVHAYLHRKEGDIGNARYWYARARRPEAEGPLDEEWTQIARALLG